MKKILMMLFLLGGFSAAAEDSYLYWMVGDTGSYVDSYNKVVVRALDSSGNTIDPVLNIYAPDADSSTGLSDSYGSVTKAQANMGALYAGLATGQPYSSFVIELYNDSSFVAQSAALSLSDATANYIVNNNSMSLPVVSPWAATSFAIPEPNSAMLLLLGCAALGLRRRRQLKA